MAKDKIEIEVLAKGVKEAQKEIDKLKNKIDKTGKQSESAGSLFKSSWLKVAGVAATVGVAMKKAFDFAQGAAKFNQSVKAMEKQFGVSSKKILSRLKEVSKGTISNADLVQSANKAMALNVTKDIDKMAKLMEVARVRGQAMGLDTTQAFEDIVTGIGRGSPLILDNLGIITKGWADEAKAAGKAMDAQFILNKVLDDGAKILEKTGDNAITDAEKFQRLGATFKNIGISIGSSLLGPFASAAGKINDLVGSKDTLIIKTGRLKTIQDELSTSTKNLTAERKALLEIEQSEITTDVIKNLDELIRARKGNIFGLKENIKYTKDFINNAKSQLQFYTKFRENLKKNNKLTDDEYEALKKVRNARIGGGFTLRSHSSQVNHVNGKIKELTDSINVWTDSQKKNEVAQGRVNDRLLMIVKSNPLLLESIRARDEATAKELEGLLAKEEAEKRIEEAKKKRAEEERIRLAKEAEDKAKKAADDKKAQDAIEAEQKRVANVYANTYADIAAVMADHNKTQKEKAKESLKILLNTIATEITAKGIAMLAASIFPPLSSGLAAGAGMVAAGETIRGLGAKSGLKQGSDFAPGGQTLVGEAGPEVVNLPQGSQVIPNSTTNNTENIDNRNININVSSPNAIEFVNDLQQTYGIDVFGGQ